jgi:acyl-CoA synthetase (AMP-forming)/AMP-acid ligase II
MRVLGDIPRLNAKRYPDKVALMMDGEALTFKQLNSAANRLSRGLAASGVNPGDKIGILSQNRLEFAIIVFAAAKCAAILVPINFRYQKNELVYVVNNSRPKVLFFENDFAELVHEAKAEFERPVRLAAIAAQDQIEDAEMAILMEGQPLSEPTIDVDPDSPAMIMYTSGTTGFPKGVLYSHASYLSVYTGLAVEGDLSNNDITLVALPLFHNGGLNALLQPTLMMGGTAVILSRGFDPDQVLDAIDRNRVTMTMWVPTMLAMLINHPTATSFNLSTLDKIWYGSSPISPTILKASREIFKSRFFQWYGQTETGMNSVLRPEDHQSRSQYTGREIFNAELRIVNEKGQEVAVGEIGEIISAQKPLGMISYHGMEKETQKTIRNGWIYTGDLARVEGNGYFTVVDRLKDMIISGAENIYPKEIEDVVSSHPAVQEVAVIGIPDDLYGESICAMVVLKPDKQIDEMAVMDICARKLAGYKKPKKVVFMEELPKNAAGKVTKHTLRQPFWEAQEKKI